MNSDTLYISPDADHEEAFYRDMANQIDNLNKKINSTRRSKVINRNMHVQAFKIVDLTFSVFLKKK